MGEQWEMQITKIKIRNFRCFGEETTIYLSRLTTLIGANSSGKTALIHALLKLFGTRPSDRELVRDDFHVPHFSVQAEQELECTIEVRIDFPELLSTDQLIAKKSVPPFFNQLVIDRPGEVPHLRIRLTGKWSPSNTPEGEVEQNLNFVTVPEGEDETNALTRVSPHQRSAIQMIYVPAIREPLTQLKNASGTILYRILKKIKWPENMDELIRNNMKPVNDLFDGIEDIAQIKDVIQEEWNKYHRDIKYQNTNIEFNSTTLSTILKKIEVQFSPAQDSSIYTIDKLGEGLRSLFYLSLVSSLLKLEQQLNNNLVPAFTILAVEEPENHISPHLLGRVTDNLKKISSQDNAQVLLSSHSTAIIKRIEPENICHLRIDNKANTTVVRRIALPPKADEAYKFIREAVKAHPEIYFAKLVILGEGDSEEVVLPKILEAHGISTDNEGLTIVPLGGRHVNHIWKLLHQLNIPHITLLDLDRERVGGGWGRIKYVLQQLLANGHDRDQLLGVTRNGKSHTITEDELEQFHERPLTEKSIEIMEKVWISRLEKYNVFFSAPLDFDFLMLEAFQKPYKQTVLRGPNLPDKMTQPEEYYQKLQHGIKATLKNENSTGETYSEEQHELMVWYNTLFLGRSKPSTHIEAMLTLDKKTLRTSCPEVLKKLVLKVKELLQL